MRKVPFKLLNQWDDIISSQNPDTLQQFHKCLEIIDQYFMYPHFLTPCLATVFLFTLAHWNQEDTEALIEVEKVRSMESEAREMMKACIAEGGTELGITYIDQLIEALSFIKSVKDVARDVKPFSDIAESRHSFPEETVW